MKITPGKLDAEDLEAEDFAKIRNKKRKIKGRQSVEQLVSHAEDPADPYSKFERTDLNELCRAGFLDELISSIKTGKEASVFLGRNTDGFVAVKVYTDLRVRSFKHDQSYRDGRFLGDTRMEKAIAQGSQRGLNARQRLWVLEEFKQMDYLLQQGVKVPKPIAVNGLVLLMEFIGDAGSLPAPRIADLKMDWDEAEDAFRQSVENLKRITKAGRVHGDYSTFNLLWQDGQVVVIDFPQVVEFRTNPNAKTLLARDVHTLCGSFAKQGVQANEAAILRDIQALG